MSVLLRHDTLPPQPALAADAAEAVAALPSPMTPQAGGAPRRSWRRWILVSVSLSALIAAALWKSRLTDAPPMAPAPAGATSAGSPGASAASGLAALSAAAANTPAARHAAQLSEMVGRVQSHPPPATPSALPRATDLLQRANAAPGTPEARLLRVYALMNDGDGAQALEEARKLTLDVPTFNLAHLVYADLLTARTAPLQAFGAGAPATAPASAASATARDPAAPDTAVSDRLKDLSAEARARVGGATGLPPAGSVPSQFLFVAPTVRHAIAVDASRSRLYVFDNTPAGLVLKRDYYASVGKLGTAKQTEGDLRTPLGIYFVTGRLTKARLADRYGASAMVLNYPNQYDLLRGRTGGGIWVHGVEANWFSRAPLATDGCVALSNVDLLTLTNDVDRQATPVVIADRLDWLPIAKAGQLPDDFSRAFDAWRDARLTPDPASELALYDAVPRAAAGASAPHWLDVLQAERKRPRSQAAQLTRLSVLAWHDQDDVVLVTYSETSAREAGPRLKRQYWLHRDGRWSIVFDGAVS